MDKEIRIEARVRNNVLWHAIYDQWSSVAEFCKEHDISMASIGNLLNLKKSPLGRQSGTWRPIVLKIAKILGFSPEELFPLALYKVERVRVVIEMPFTSLPDMRELKRLPAPRRPDEDVIDEELRAKVRKVLDTLTPREKIVIEGHILDDESIEEIGKKLRVGKARVHQIVKKALYKLRLPRRSKYLKPFIDGD